LAAPSPAAYCSLYSSSALAADPAQSQIAAAINEVSDRATLIVREEIELAKAEIAEKAKVLARAAAVGAAAGVFAVLGLLFLLHSLSWGFYDIWGGGDLVWLGYLTTALILFVLGGVAGFLAFKWVKRGSPPTPVMAIDEAKRVRETVKGSPPVGSPGAGS